MNEYKAKITIDAQQATTSAHDTARAVGGTTAAFGSFSALIRGDVVGSLTQARAAFMGLRMAMMTNPVVALATALITLGAALAGVAWRKKQQEAEDYKKALDDLSAATEQYKRTIKDLEFKGAGPEGKRRILSAERSSLDYQIYKEESTPGLNDTQKAERDTRVLQLREEMARKDFEIAQLDKAIRADQAKKSGENSKAQAEYDQALAEKSARANELRGQLREADPGYTAQDKIKDLTAEITAMEKERGSIMFDMQRKADLEVQILEKKLELQRAVNSEAERESAEKAKLTLDQQKASEAEQREAEKAARDAEKTAKAAEDSDRAGASPLEGFESFMQASAGNFGSTIGKSDTERAKGFRSSLNKSAIESLGRDFGGKESADSKLEELQRESRDYLKAIYETWKPWNLTGAGE